MGGAPLISVSSRLMFCLCRVRPLPVRATGVVDLNVLGVVVFHMWAHVDCLDEPESGCFFSEMPVIIFPPPCFFFFFFDVTCFTGEHQKFLSVALSSPHSPNVPSPRAPSPLPTLKVSSAALSFFSVPHCASDALALFSCLRYIFTRSLPGVYHNGIVFPLSFFLLHVLAVPLPPSQFSPRLLSIRPSSSSCPSPSAERWMDGTKWLMNQ